MFTVPSRIGLVGGENSAGTLYSAAAAAAGCCECWLLAAAATSL